jgi:hypothetical protein
LWLEVLGETGVDLSLMSAAEMDAMVTYGMLLKVSTAQRAGTT